MKKATLVNVLTSTGLNFETDKKKTKANFGLLRRY